MTPQPRKNPGFYDELIRLIPSKYPSLHVVVENGTVYVRGTFPLYEPDTGQEIDRYWIEIQFPNNYPKEIPVVCEVGGQIPKIADRHFLPNGNACLFLPEERWKYFPEGATVIDFLEGPVYQFFLGQTYFDLTGKWIFGERGHGIKGVLEFYSEILKLSDPKIILKFVDYLGRKKVKKYWSCFCFSGKKLGACHWDILSEMRNKIKRSVAQVSLNNLKAVFKRDNQLK